MNLNLQCPKPQRTCQKSFGFQTALFHALRDLIAIPQKTIGLIALITLIDDSQITRAFSESENRSVSIRIPIKFFFGRQAHKFRVFCKRKKKRESLAGNAGTGRVKGRASVASENLVVLRFYYCEGFGDGVYF